MDESKMSVFYGVTDKYHKGFKRSLQDVTEVVIHHTDGEGTTKGMINWMLGGEFSSSWSQGIGLFHFLVGKKGVITKMGPIARWWYHSCSQSHDKHTVGIELIHKSGEFTGGQYEALEWIICDLVAFHCPNLKRVVSHDYNYRHYSNDQKGCPGPSFDWNKLRGIIELRGIACEQPENDCLILEFPDGYRDTIS